MESFEIKSQSLTSRYEYKDDNVVVSGKFESNKAETEIVSIQGDVHRASVGAGVAHGEYIGNFNGTMGSDDEMEYSVSKMSKSKMTLVRNTIDKIELHVLPAEEEEVENENGNEE